MKAITTRLKEACILDFRASFRTKRYEISLKTNIDDLAYALSGEECFEKYSAAFIDR